MRKIILFILCVFCTTVFGQDMVRPLYPNATVSPNHHMTFLGISMGKSVSAFEAALKQKGFKYTKDPYSDEYFFKGNAFGLSNAYMKIFTDDSQHIKYLYITKKVYNKSAVEKSISALKNFINVNYKNKCYTERNLYREDNFKEKNCLWDIFSADKSYHTGNINVEIGYHSIEYIFEVYVEDISNSDLNYMQKRYDLSQYITPTYAKAYLDVFPKYSNLVMYNSDGTSEVYNIQFPDDFTKFIYSDKYNEFEKKFIFYEYAKDVKKMNIPKSSSLYNLESIYNLRLDYDRAKAEYLSSHPQNNGYGIANFFFDSVMGKDLVNFYKSSGQYDYFIDCLKKGSRNGSSSGSSTNWDGLSDSQKAVIHEHDNAR